MKTSPRVLAFGLEIGKIISASAALAPGAAFAQPGAAPPPAAAPPAPAPVAPPAAAPPEALPAPTEPPAADAAPPAATPAGPPATSPFPPSPTAAVAPAPAAPLTATPEPVPPRKASEGIVVSSQDGDQELALRGLVQADGRFFFEGTGTDTFLVRRVRPILDAKVFRFFELRIQTDFAGGRLSLLDAYGNLHFIDEIQLRVGKGKAPVGLERLQSPADITFAERGFPTLLVPNRDVGAQLHGKLLNGALEYALGVYNGVPTGASGDEDENNEKDVIGRLFARPFQPLEVPLLENLGLGIAIEHGTQDGALPVHRSAGQQVLFEYSDGVVAAGDRLIVAPQAYLAVGPAALLAEYAVVEERVSDGTESTDVESEAWQVAASVVVYGGKPSYQGVKVDAPLDPEAGSVGAFEVGARYNELRISQEAFTFADRAGAVRRASAWAAVGSWYFARRVRAQAHYERTTFRGGAATGARSSEGVLVARLQVAF